MGLDWSAGYMTLTCNAVADSAAARPSIVSMKPMRFSAAVLCSACSTVHVHCAKAVMHRAKPCPNTCHQHWSGSVDPYHTGTTMAL